MRTRSYVASLAVAAIGVFALGQAALASDDEGCTDLPKEQWQTIGQLEQKLAAEGYKVREIEFEGRCVEVKVEDKDGKRTELKLDPVSAAVVKSERE